LVLFRSSATLQIPCGFKSPPVTMALLRCNGIAGPSIVHQEFSEDHKTLEIQITTLSGETRTLWRDHDSAWISPADGAMDVTSPDGKWVAFISDRSGWPHLYVIPTDATSESQARHLARELLATATLRGLLTASRLHTLTARKVTRWSVSSRLPRLPLAARNLSSQTVVSTVPPRSLLMARCSSTSVAQSNTLSRFTRSRRSPELWLLGLPTRFHPDCFHRTSSCQPQFTIRAGPTQNQFQLRALWIRAWISLRSIRPSSGFMALAPIKTIWLGTPAFTACTTQ
jgi:hypothetical protein